IPNAHNAARADVFRKLFEAICHQFWTISLRRLALKHLARIMDLLDELQSRIVPGDGAMGTVLIEADIPLERCFEELCVSQPDLIRGIHEQYIAAGARVIETNSFGANAARL